MVAVVRSETVAYLKGTGHYENLLKYLYHAVMALLFFVASALLVLILQAVNWPMERFHRLITAVLAVVLVFSLLASLRATRIMFKILLVT